jgi:hypothetical protein
MEREPISQAWMIEVMDQVKEDMKEGHGRVRQTLNELKVEMKSGFERVATKQEAIDARLNRHSDRMLIMETARDIESKQVVTDKARITNRNVVAASLTSTVITIAIFVIKAILHL